MVKMAYCERANDSLEVPITAFSGSSLQSPEDRFLGELGLPVRGTQTGVMEIQRFLRIKGSIGLEQSRKGDSNVGCLQWEIPPR